jgi:hypothetical protein
MRAGENLEYSREKFRCYLVANEAGVKSQRGIGILPMTHGLEARATTRKLDPASRLKAAN